MPGASKSRPFSGRILLKSLINQLQLKVQLGDSGILEAKDLGGVGTMQLLKGNMSQWKKRLVGNSVQVHSKLIHRDGKWSQAD